MMTPAHSGADTLQRCGGECRSRWQKNEKPASLSRRAPISDRAELLQRIVDVRELGVQVGTEAVDHSDDRERNAGCNQSIFDGGGSGFIIQETRNKFGHFETPRWTKARGLAARESQTR